MLTGDALRSFGAQGFLTVGGAVPGPVLREAQQALAAYPEPAVPGPHFDFPTLAGQPALAALYAAPAVTDAVEGLLGPGNALPSHGLQLARTLPPFPRPHAGRPHIDGTTGEPGGRPDSFSLLAGIALTGQLTPADGGLWVWPGSHREHAAHYAARGPEAFWAGDPGFPSVTRAEPVMLAARAGDLILCHYLLGHCPGGVESRVRVTTYLRVTSRRHAWRESMVDWRHDFPPVHEALRADPADVV